MNTKVNLTALYQSEIRKFDEYDLEDFKDPGKWAKPHILFSLDLNPNFLIWFSISKHNPR